MDNRWRVVTYLNTGVKLTMIMGENDGAEAMAREHARMNIQRGPFVDDDRGIRTYYPPSVVDKVKVIPPGSELNKTETEVA